MVAGSMPSSRPPDTAAATTASREHDGRNRRCNGGYGEAGGKDDEPFPRVRLRLQTKSRRSLGDQSLRRGLAILSALRHRSSQHVVETLRQHRTTFARDRRVVFEMSVEDGDLGRISKGERSRQRLEQEASQCVDVGAAVDLVSTDLLRRHIIHRSHQAPVSWLTIRSTLGQAEIGKVRVLAPSLLVEQNVRGLHIPVHEPRCVGRVESICNLDCDCNRACRLERALAAQKLLQVRAIDVTHRDEQPSIRLSRLIDRDDVRVIEARRKARLAQHPISETDVFGEIPKKELQRHRPLQASITSAIDLAHPSTAEHVLDHIASDHLTGSDLGVDGQRNTSLV